MLYSVSLVPKLIWSNLAVYQSEIKKILENFNNLSEVNVHKQLNYLINIIVEVSNKSDYNSNQKKDKNDKIRSVQI